MLEETIPSIWSTVYGFFTPAVFFILLNVVIGTIAVTSKGSHSGGRGGASSSYAGEHRGGLTRAPSIVLDRLRSFNLNRFRSGEISIETVDFPPDTDRSGDGGVPATSSVGEHRGGLSRAPSIVLDRLRSFSLNRFRSGEISSETVQLPPATDRAMAAEEEEENHSHENDHIERSRSDSQLPAGRLPARMKKSASDKSAFAHFEDVEIPPRPETARARPETARARPETARARPAPAAEEEDGGVDARCDDFINKFRNQLRLQRLDSIMRYKEMITRGSAN